jgi:hypothetical protein
MIRTTLRKTLTVALVLAVAATTWGAKKNEPDEPEEILKTVGGKHYIEDMDINSVGSMEVENEETEEESYFHIYSSYADERYRVIIFDNTPEYLGYYETNFEPAGYEEGVVLLDAGDGESYFRIPLDYKGPKDSVMIDGLPSAFVKNEKLEQKRAVEAAKAAQSGSQEELQPEYREFVLIKGGNKIPVEAIYIKQAGNKVTLKRKKDGKRNDFPLNMLSKEDQEYVKQFK